MTWKSSYLPAVLALGFVLTGPAGKAQQTHGATTPKKRVPHPPSGTAVKPPANAVTNQSVPTGTGSAGKVPYNPFAITKQVNQASPQLASTGGGKKGTANGGASGGSGGFSDVVGVSQSKDTNVSEFRAGSDKPLRIVPKGQPASGGSRVSTQAATLPANAVQANPNPPKRKKPAAPPHQP
jgi:hypothetical protein